MCLEKGSGMKKAASPNKPIDSAIKVANETLRKTTTDMYIIAISEIHAKKPMVLYSAK